MRLHSGRFPQIEAIEARVLLSTFASLSSHGTLSIVGTGGVDAIIASKAGDQIVAKVNGKSLSFAAVSVKRLWINGFRGDDSIRNETKLPSSLIGAAGDDTLIGGAGADSIDGGAGKDWLRPSDGDNRGTLDPREDSLDYGSATPGRLSLFASAIESSHELTVDHQIGSDAFELRPDAGGPLRFFATAGADDIGGLVDIDVEVHGGAGNDRLYLSSDSAKITLLGEAGNDSIFSNGEDYFIEYGDGGPGNDHYEYENAYFAGPYADTGGGMDSLIVYAAAGAGPSFEASVPPGIERCEVYAEFFPTTVTGNMLDNRIIVRARQATVYGGAGDDSISVEADSSVVFGDAGDDTLRGGGGNDTLSGGAGRDKLFGQAGDDLLLGRGGSRDTLDGGNGIDTATQDHGPGVVDLVADIELLS